MRPALLRTVPATLLLAATAAAAPQGPTWVALDTAAPPGEPAEFVVLHAQSSPQRTVCELRVPGFWREPVIGADGAAYERLDFPGLGELGASGAPELPALRPRLAVVTGATAVTRFSETVAAGDLHTFALQVYPTPTPELDAPFGDPDGEPEVFQKDLALYATDAFFPAEGSAASVPAGASLPNAFPTGRLELTPARFNPVQGTLEVASLTQYAFDHGGTAQAFPPLSKDAYALAQAACPNLPSVGGFVAPNLQQFDARYLIVTPEQYLDELEPFVQYRKGTGYAVTILTLESLPSVSCGEIRGGIDAWYQVGAGPYDHYCLLVGDVDTIPYCPSPTIGQVPGDDLYGSPSGSGDLDEEVYVGRLSVDDGADLSDQLGKIVEYETDTTAAHDYSDVLLVAHEEEAPGKYVGAHEAVANAAYATPPSFTKLYGDSILATDFDVRQAVNAGQGVVAYRGHGTSEEWIDWNGFEDFDLADVALLSNSQLPVVWSFSCTNGALENGDNLGEVWMETDGRAVAHYGSTRNSGTSENHTLDRALFEAVFDLGLTTHAQAIAYAEDVLHSQHLGSEWQNEWMYLLLGDPAMKLRRGAPKPLDIGVATEFQPGAGPTPLTVLVQDAFGNPKPDVLVSVFKPSAIPGLPDEVFANAYTGSGGATTIPIDPLTIGVLIVWARDDDGNIASEQIQSKEGAFKWRGAGLAGSQGQVPLLQSSATLQGGQPLNVNLSQSLGFAPGALAVGAVDNPTPLFGGTVYAAPYFLLVPFVVNGQGKWTFHVPSVPQGLPAGVELYWQAGVADDGAVQGIALSNALRSELP